MSGELKPEMWESTVQFLEQIGCEDVKDVTWDSNEDAGIKRIIVTFEHPIYKRPVEVE